MYIHICVCMVTSVYMSVIKSLQVNMYVRVAKLFVMACCFHMVSCSFHQFVLAASRMLQGKPIYYVLCVAAAVIGMCCIALPLCG